MGTEKRAEREAEAQKVPSVPQGTPLESALKAPHMCTAPIVFFTPCQKMDL